jgi:hypothetical protein
VASAPGAQAMIPAPLWVRDPCAILAEGAARGIVVDSGRIVETVPAGAEPITPGCTVFVADAVHAALDDRMFYSEQFGNPGSHVSVS